MRIWKYTIEVANHQELALHSEAKILAVQMQGGECRLWALVDETKKDMATRRIAIYGTGHPIPDDPGNYIGTFQIMGGDLVFHAFERAA